MHRILDEEEVAACDEYARRAVREWSGRTGNSITITDPIAIQRVVTAFTRDTES